MSSTTTRYRNEHPEWREQEKAKDRERLKMMYQDNPEYREKVKDRERFKAMYQNNPEYREKVKQTALARYYRLKEEKACSVQVS